MNEWFRSIAIGVAKLTDKTEFDCLTDSFDMHCSAVCRSRYHWAGDGSIACYVK